MAAATKKEKKRRSLTLGRLALVAGTQQTLSNLLWRLSISMVNGHHKKRKRSLERLVQVAGK
jgi:hypothetical protein